MWLECLRSNWPRETPHQGHKFLHMLYVCSETICCVTISKVHDVLLCYWQTISIQGPLTHLFWSCWPYYMVFISRYFTQLSWNCRCSNVPLFWDFSSTFAPNLSVITFLTLETVVEWWWNKMKFFDENQYYCVVENLHSRPICWWRLCGQKLQIICHLNYVSFFISNWSTGILVILIIVTNYLAKRVAAYILYTLNSI